MYNNTCMKCGSNYFYNLTIKDCVECNETCATCSGTSALNCLSCPSLTYLFTNGTNKYCV